MAKKKSSSKVKDVLSKEVDIPVPKGKGKVSDTIHKKRRLRMPKYFRDSYKELKKVTWPSRKDAWKLTLAVGLFTLFFAGVIALFDYIFAELIERIIL